MIIKKGYIVEHRSVWICAECGADSSDKSRIMHFATCGKAIHGKDAAEAESYRRGCMDAAKTIEMGVAPTAELLSKFVTQTFRDAISDAELRGAEQMRERAVACAVTIPVVNCGLNFTPPISDATRRIQNAIRALPLRDGEVVTP